MRLNDEIAEVWRTGGSLDRLLAQLVVETASRASGCWRLENDHLVLVGFGWADDMPDSISTGFQDATRRVPLSQTGLGIVKAATTSQPAIGRRDPRNTGLDGSATWIEKFGANTSLAVPICRTSGDVTTGVIAVSTAEFVEEGDLLWNRLHELARELASADE